MRRRTALSFIPVLLAVAAPLAHAATIQSFATCYSCLQTVPLDGTFSLLDDDPVQPIDVSKLKLDFVVSGDPNDHPADVVPNPTIQNPIHIAPNNTATFSFTVSTLTNGDPRNWVATLGVDFHVGSGPDQFVQFSFDRSSTATPEPSPAAFVAIGIGLLIPGLWKRKRQESVARKQEAECESSGEAAWVSVHP